MSSARFEAAQDASPERLAQPLTFTFSKKVAQNRLMHASMAEMLSSWHPTDVEKRGIPSKELIELYKRYASLASTRSIQQPP